MKSDKNLTSPKAATTMAGSDFRVKRNKHRATSSANVNTPTKPHNIY